MSRRLSKAERAFRWLTSRPSFWVFLSFIVMLVILSLLVFVFADEAKTPLENNLIQFIFFVAGAALSYLFGRQSVTAGVQERLKGIGRVAFRRLKQVIGGIQETAVEVDKQKEYLRSVADARGKVEFVQVEHTLKTLRNQVSQETVTASSAIEDWRDVMPEEISELEENLRRQKAKENESLEKVKIETDA